MIPLLIPMRHKCKEKHGKNGNTCGCTAVAGSCANIGDAENVKKNVSKIDNTRDGRELCWYRMQKI